MQHPMELIREDLACLLVMLVLDILRFPVLLAKITDIPVPRLAERRLKVGTVCEIGRKNSSEFLINMTVDIVLDFEPHKLSRFMLLGIYQGF